jgi:hypothetical protein
MNFLKVILCVKTDRKSIVCFGSPVKPCDYLKKKM